MTAAQLKSKHAIASFEFNAMDFWSENLLLKQYIQKYIISLFYENVYCP